LRRGAGVLGAQRRPEGVHGGFDDLRGQGIAARAGDRAGVFQGEPERQVPPLEPSAFPLLGAGRVGAVDQFLAQVAQLAGIKGRGRPPRAGATVWSFRFRLREAGEGQHLLLGHLRHPRIGDLAGGAADDMRRIKGDFPGRGCLAAVPSQRHCLIAPDPRSPAGSPRVCGLVMCSGHPTTVFHSRPWADTLT
jgi:hypothetical protein